MAKGQYILETYKIPSIYVTKEQADSAQKRIYHFNRQRCFKKALTQVEKTLSENKAQVETDTKLIDAYPAKNNISH